jgi:23S rRNA pseudouridine1911/1915/1917 synthase
VVVPVEARGARLDRFLASALAGLDSAPSRAELQRWIDHGRVTVDGVVKKCGDRVKEGARVLVEPEPRARTDARAEEGIELDVLYTDEHLVVVNKPAGLVVHPARGHEGGTLVNGLLGRGLFDVKAFGIDESDPDAIERERPGIVHRLDKGTSGVMVVARTAAAREGLKVQFAAHTIERVYEAIVCGRIEEEVVFDTLHGRHPRDRMKFSSKVKTGKRAVTHVIPVEPFSVATHVRCEIETGRTHQIRVHLADSGTPVLGDPLYGKPPKSEALRNVGAALGRQALHARVLGFTHPATGRAMSWDVNPPADFQVALTTLRALPE